MAFTKPAWVERERNDYWLTDFSTLPDTGGLSDRTLPGRWASAAYEGREFGGTLVIANPSQGAPALHIPLPVSSGRWSISVGLVVNYCDRLLLKLRRDRCLIHLRHSPAAPTNQAIEECWWSDRDIQPADELVLAQDIWMKRRCGVAFVRLRLAPPELKAEVPIYTTADGLAGNNGPIDLGDQMMAEELAFDGTHASDILHGTDINGAAQYMTALPQHRHPTHEAAQEVHADNEYYPWTVEQMLKYERAGRCPLRDSIAAAHSIGRRLIAYYRMAITRLHQPYKGLFRCPLYDQHPEWRCVDFDGTPVTRLSVAFPEVRRFMVEHFRETIEFGADGVCLVFSRGWPLVLYEKPVADAFAKKTGRSMASAGRDDPELRQLRADMITGLLREIRQAALATAGGRQISVVAMVLAQPAFNRQFGMDCGAWAREGLIETLIPYPYGPTAQAAPIDVAEWLHEIKGTGVKLCPTLNRMTYEPAGIWETPLGMVDRADEWLAAGVDGFSFWDLDSAMSLPTMRGLAYLVGSKEGRTRFRATAGRGPVYHELLSLDAMRLDRYGPGWNV